MNHDVVYSVTDFVATTNQILDLSFGGRVIIEGELANYKISKNKWLYFDLKDADSSLKFFGNIFQLPSPLEEGMMLQIIGQPQLHPRFGFSISVSSIQLVGKGTIKKSAELLEKQLEKEGLFNLDRKRQLVSFPSQIGVISSKESAGFQDFIKIANQRWGGVDIKFIDVLVQGEKAPSQITSAINYFNQKYSNIDCLVIIRGGGSADDLRAYNHEKVIRAIAGSRIPTLVAIGHETDNLLAEKVADLRASTPSHAAQILLPDKKAQQLHLKENWLSLTNLTSQLINFNKQSLKSIYFDIVNVANTQLLDAKNRLHLDKQLLKQYNPQLILQRGYVIVRQSGRVISKSTKLNLGKELNMQFQDSSVTLKSVKVSSTEG